MLLVYGLDAEQSEGIAARRHSIYELRDFLVAENLVHAVAHATFSINGRVKLSHIERLLLLFDCFEGINGSRDQASNEALMQVLSSLTPARLAALSRTYGIAPTDEESKAPDIGLADPDTC